MSNAIVIKSKKKFVDYLPSFMKSIHSMFYYYLFLILLGIIFFSSSLFINYFTTPYTGDYTSQQFAFYTNGYDDWWHFFKTGEFVLYDQNTFLGADNIGSNSFYYLFDPFFLPILLVPRQLIPQFMAVLTILKISAAGMVFFLYMRYLGASRTASKITGIAYAFSGWMTWYLWFNHFTEITIVLPLILLGVEIVLKEKKPWVLMFAIALMGFVNYFFLICFVMCAFLYAIFRYFQRIRLNKIKDNLLILGLGFVGFLVGIIIPAMVVFPSAMHALTSPRASGNNYLVFLKDAFKSHNFKRIMDLLTSWTANGKTDQNRARSLYPFIDFIFPVTSDRGTPLTVYGNETYDNVAGSTYCFLPMMMLLVPAFINSFRKKHFSVVIPLAFFIFALFTPCFYYLFHGFTQAYSRWTLFVTTSILAYTGLYLDEIKNKSFINLIIGGLTLIILTLIAGWAANEIVKKYNQSYTERVPIWLAILIECIYIVLFVSILILTKFKKKLNFYGFFTGFISLEIAAMGAFVIQGHGVEDYYYTNKGFIKNDVLHSLVEKTKKKDPTYYRSFSSLASSDASNDEMRNNYNGASFFHSIYNYNVADICNWSSITGGVAPGSWSGHFVQKRNNLDFLLGMKYYYVEDDYFYYQSRKEASSDKFRYNVPLNYLDITSTMPNKEFRVYKNMDYVDFALTYDTVYPTYGNPNESDSYEGLYSASSRSVLALEELYLQGAIINKYRDETIVDDIKNNHPDIEVSDIPNRVPSFYYTYVKTESYKESGGSSYYDAMITFYDIYSSNQGLKSLDLTAKDYVTLLNTDNNTFVKSASPENGDFYRRYCAVMEAKGECFPNYDPNGNIFYLSATFANKYQIDVYLVDTNNQIVTYDNHNDGYYSGTRGGKEYRTFYTAPEYGLDENGQLVIKSPAPKIKKIILASRNYRMRSSYPLYIDSYTSWNNKLSNFKNYPVTDVKSSANKYTFKTNFDKERVVMTRLAYEDGFTLKMVDYSGKKSNVKVFNGQGGFASFISGTGNCSYVLEFYTPYLQLSSYISMVGVLSFFGSIVAYTYFAMENEKKSVFYKFKRQ